MCNTLHRVHGLFALCLVPKILIGQVEENTLAYVTIQGRSADSSAITGTPGSSQSGRRRITIMQDLTFQKRSICMIVSDLERTTFACLVIVMNLLGLCSRIADLIIKITGMNILTALQLVIDRLATKAKLQGDLGN